MPLGSGYMGAKFEHFQNLPTFLSQRHPICFMHLRGTLEDLRFEDFTSEPPRQHIPCNLIYNVKGIKTLDIVLQVQLHSRIKRKSIFVILFCIVYISFSFSMHRHLSDTDLHFSQTETG